MTEKATKQEIEMLKKTIVRMSKSGEQFLFMIFKEEDGSDHITQYSFNMRTDKIINYWQKALKSGRIRGDR